MLSLSAIAGLFVSRRIAMGRPRRFDRRHMGQRSGERTCQRRLIVGIEPDIVLTARDRDVRESPIDEGLASDGLDVDKDAIRGLSLAAVAGDGIPIVEMWSLVDIETHGLAGVEPHVQVPRALEACHGAQLAIRNVTRAIGRGDLHAVTQGESHLGLAVNGDALQSAGIVRDGHTAMLHGEEIVSGVDGLDLCVVSCC